MSVVIQGQSWARPLRELSFYVMGLGSIWARPKNEQRLGQTYEHENWHQPEEPGQDRHTNPSLNLVGLWQGRSWVLTPDGAPPQEPMPAPDTRISVNEMRTRSSLLPKTCRLKPHRRHQSHAFIQRESYTSGCPELPLDWQELQVSLTTAADANRRQRCLYSELGSDARFAFA